MREAGGADIGIIENPHNRRGARDRRTIDGVGTNNEGMCERYLWSRENREPAQNKQKAQAESYNHQPS